MKKLFFFFTAFIILNGCKKFVDAGFPSTQLAREQVFNDAATAHGAMMGIYASIEANYFMYDLILTNGLSADEFINYSSSQFNIDIAGNNLTTDNPTILRLWELSYKYINHANNILKGVEASSLNIKVKNQIAGEAKFTRAFFHYYLTCLFGEIPVVMTDDYRITSRQGRLSQTEVIDAIKNDLKDAIVLLSEEYINNTGGPSTERVRPNRFSAKAMLLRILMMEQKWKEAEQLASEIINQSTSYSLASNPNNAFLKNSSEAIWQLMAVRPLQNSTVGAQMILVTTPSVYALDTLFVNTFQLGDLRKSAWINSITVSGKRYFFPYKYKVGQNVSSITEYTMVLRLSEVILNRAECLAQEGKLSGAILDLNRIRSRAGLPLIFNENQSEILEAIYNERRFELFAESGLRWFDIRRWRIENEIMSKKKNSTWDPNDILYPVPQIERDRNPALSQNPGY